MIEYISGKCKVFWMVGSKKSRVNKNKFTIVFVFSVDYFFFHGFRIESTIMPAIIRTKNMAIIMHFLDLFCKALAVWRAFVPVFTCSTAFVTYNRGRKERTDC